MIKRRQTLSGKMKEVKRRRKKLKSEHDFK
jgi:hypothetical protein